VAEAAGLSLRGLGRFNFSGTGSVWAIAAGGSGRAASCGAGDWATGVAVIAGDSRKVANSALALSATFLRFSRSRWRSARSVFQAELIS